METSTGKADGAWAVARIGRSTPSSAAMTKPGAARRRGSIRDVDMAREDARRGGEVPAAAGTEAYDPRRPTRPSSHVGYHPCPWSGVQPFHRGVVADPCAPYDLRL